MKLGTYVTASDVLSKSPVAGGKWVHVAFTSSHTAKKAQFYINGKLVNENTLDGSEIIRMLLKKRVSKDIWMKCVIIKK